MGKKKKNSPFIGRISLKGMFMALLVAVIAIFGSMIFVKVFQMLFLSHYSSFHII